MSISNLFSDKIYPNLRSYTILLASLIGGILVTFNFLGGGKNQSNSKENGLVAVDDSNQYLWVHSSNVLWEKSPVFVEKGSQISIITSGTYCSNVDSLISGHRRAYLINASGNKKSNRDSLTNTLLTFKKGNYGQLMLQIVDKNNRPKIKPRKEEIFLLDDGKNEFYINKDGYLWFSTNHPSLSPYERNQTKVYNDFTGKSISLNKLKQEKYEPFFDDNFGQIFMQIKIIE